jgi:hypothetical protein
MKVQIGRIDSCGIGLLAGGLSHSPSGQCARVSAHTQERGYPELATSAYSAGAGGDQARMSEPVGSAANKARPVSTGRS